MPEVEREAVDEGLAIDVEGGVEESVEVGVDVGEVAFASRMTCCWMCCCKNIWCWSTFMWQY